MLEYLLTRDFLLINFSFLAIAMSVQHETERLSRIQIHKPEAIKLKEVSDFVTPSQVSV
jgi:hypothetical protein